MDKLGVINKALMKVGLPLAASLQDADWNATTAYESAVKQALRSFPWGFATKFANFQANQNVPAHGFSHAYTMPADCVRVIDVRQAEELRAPKARFVVSGRLVYANVTPCHARYVSSEYVDTPANWPDDFADAVSCRIAADIANLSAQTASMTAGLLQMYQLALAQAQAVDATETTERVPMDESIIAAREGQQ